MTREGSMFTTKCVVAAAVVFMSLIGLGAQAPQHDETVRKAFMTWFKTAPAVRGNPVAACTAVHLAGKGWKVTGVDLSAEAIKSAHANAAKAGVRINAVKASYVDFDFGTSKWDLIVLTFAWAPMTDEAFVARLRTSLGPNGRIVFEHFIEGSDQRRPPAMHALKPGQLREALKGFRLDRCEELQALADCPPCGMSRR
jgi:SAM-dependent methyltransferase